MERLGATLAPGVHAETFSISVQNMLEYKLKIGQNTEKVELFNNKPNKPSAHVDIYSV